MSPSLKTPATVKKIPFLNSQHHSQPFGKIWNTHLEQKISDRDRQDEFTQECVRDGELMMLELDQRRLLMEEALGEVDRTSQCYENILKFCTNHSHEDISSLERVLQSRKEEFNSLLRKQRQIEYEIRHLRLVEKPELEKEILTRQQMQSTILSKLEHSIQEENERAKRELEIMNRRQEIGEDDEEFEDDDDELEEEQQQQDEERIQLNEEKSADVRVHEQIHLGQFKSSLEQMKLCCGASDSSEVYSRFVNREKDMETLLNRRGQCEERLQAVKDDVSALQNEFDRLQNELASSQRIRDLESENSRENEELSSMMKQEEQVKSDLMPLRNGLVDLAKKLGIQCDVSDWVRFLSLSLSFSTLSTHELTHTNTQKNIIMELNRAHARAVGVIGRIGKD